VRFDDFEELPYQRCMADPIAPATPRVHGLDPASVHRFVEDLVGEDLHARRVLSLANGVVGVLHAATLAIHTIGEALAEALLTLLGAAAEKIGFDRLLKVNTAKKRTHSLFRQGSYWYGAIPAMRESRLRELMTAFADVIAQHKVLCEIFGVI
jgi:hypothetical protein